ncbi:hypothetical protein [Marinimicrobium sp. LS-A18]|uniref:hypothetical protein n=1 Tax=Marinimicrobium sp. LS-A18 TaxID=1381596 RepID=UPI00126837DE|nr:hypothetical protein [Marinimicrobium sp. LS-A18]
MLIQPSKKQLTAMHRPDAIFINRRRGPDRRREPDPCAEMPMDLYHRKRRKSLDRRTPGRSLEQDYYAYFSEVGLYSHH